MQTVGLESGAIRVGRDSASDLHLQDNKVSRRHCEIRLDGDQVTVTDLQSQNGCQLDGERIPPHRPATWIPGQTLRVGPFELQLDAPAASQVSQEVAPRSTAGVRSVYSGAAPAVQPYARTWRIACGLAQPSMVTVKDRPVVIGRDANCHMVLDDERISHRQARVHQENGQLWVTDLSQRDTTRLGDEPVPSDHVVPWPEGTLLQVGPFAFSQSGTVDVASMNAAQAAQAAQAAAAADFATQPAQDENIGSRMWQAWFGGIPWLPISMAIGGLCLVLGITAGVIQIIRSNREATPVAVATETLSPGETPRPSETPLPSETPSATPLAQQTPGGQSVALPTNTPLPTLPPCTPQAAGWLDLPFPYDGKNENRGTSEQFRLASQRTANGGRINSFFDHEFPLYTGEGDASESLQPNDTMVIFDGSRVLDKSSHPKEEGDFYSGHPGIDFSTYEWGKSTTPVFAAADGIFLDAGTDNLGNNYVHILHDRGDEGSYRTSYLHLENDEYFFAMLAMEPNTPLRSGQRIGTMGNTGNSSGHHLHFEIRKDCNEDGRFTLMEAVDPYGFTPSLQVSTDPMAGLTCGGSEYLWRITWDPDEEGGGCTSPEQRRQLDPAPFQGVISIATFIFTTANQGAATTVPVPIAKSMSERVDIAKIKVYRYDVDAASGIGRWVVVEPDPIIRTRNTGLYAEVELDRSGKYTLTGRPLDDVIPPQTNIQLTGPQSGDTFAGSVTVELIGTDNSTQGVREIKYSLDCGQSWQTYDDRPFTLITDDLTVCGLAEEAEKGNEWGLEENEYLILATSVDWSNNFEQPASPQRFKLTTQ